MASKLRTFLFFLLAISVFLFSSVITSFGDTTTYIYDELNRLIEIRYDDAGKIESTPPTTTANPTGGAYGASQSVTLTCNDGQGSGCDKIYYTTDGTTPTTSSSVYTSPINITVNTTLKFFSRDFVGNSETVQTQT